MVLPLVTIPAYATAPAYTRKYPAPEHVLQSYQVTAMCSCVPGTVALHAAIFREVKKDLNFKNSIRQFSFREEFADIPDDPREASGAACKKLGGKGCLSEVRTPKFGVRNRSESNT